MLAILFSAIVGLSIWLNQADIAIRIIEIGGAVLLGYFAGLNRGKAKILEQQQQFEGR